MKKSISFLFIFLLSLSLTYALSVTESISKVEVDPNEKILIIYTPTDFQNRVAWFAGRDVPDGWTIISSASVLVEGNSYAMLGITSFGLGVEIRAPATPGEYTFTDGEWGIVDALEDGTDVSETGVFSDFTIIVNEGTSTCEPDVWSCNSWPDCDEGDELVQRTCTNDCGDTKTETKACDTEPHETGESFCDKLPDIAGDATFNCIIWAFIAMFALMMLMSLFPSRN